MVDSHKGGAFEELELRLRTMLPEQYQDCYDAVQPLSMGSAGLKYGSDGKVAWDAMWGSFCDLAMAGGPPHKGTLLAPGSREEIDAQPDRYREVVQELCRGIELVTGLCAEPSPSAGWVRLYCTSAAMAGWLARAIVMENVSATFQGLALSLPAGPGYRIEKEIKNVVTVIAKTSHYWLQHTSYEQHQAIAEVLRAMESESPLLQPGHVHNSLDAYRDHGLSNGMAEALQQATGLRASEHSDGGWLGLECGNVRAAIWMMRVLVVSNMLSRREGTVVFVPADLVRDPEGATVARLVARAHSFARSRGIL